MTELISTRAPKEVIEEVDRFAKEKGLGRTVLVKILLTKGLEKFKIEYAIEKYRKGEVSLWKGADLAGVSLWVFMDEVKNKKISHYTLEDAKEDIKQVFGK